MSRTAVNAIVLTTSGPCSTVSMWSRHSASLLPAPIAREKIQHLPWSQASLLRKDRFGATQTFLQQRVDLHRTNLCMFSQSPCLSASLVSLTSSSHGRTSYNDMPRRHSHFLEACFSTASRSDGQRPSSGFAALLTTLGAVPSAVLAELPTRPIGRRGANRVRGSTELPELSP